MSRFVQHISGHGEQWLVEEETHVRWSVRPNNSEYMANLHLPKSEYRLCEPPEQWVDVTADCELIVVLEEMQPTLITRRLRGYGIRYKGEIVPNPDHYRLRKVQLWKLTTYQERDKGETYRMQDAFIIERRQL